MCYATYLEPNGQVRVRQLYCGSYQDIVSQGQRFLRGRPGVRLEKIQQCLRGYQREEAEASVTSTTSQGIEPG